MSPKNLFSYWNIYKITLPKFVFKRAKSLINKIKFIFELNKGKKKYLNIVKKNIRRNGLPG